MVIMSSQLGNGADLVLQKIGLDLDRNIFPTVGQNGVVMPVDAQNHSIQLSTEIHYETAQKQAFSEAQSWQRPPLRRTQTLQSRASCSAASFVCPVFRAQYTDELDIISSAYPGLKFWMQDRGMWIRYVSELIQGEMKKAVFLCSVPFDPRLRVQSWGFWNGCAWIGPRHTNLPDGSICAFNPLDGSWKHGDSILALLDIYVVWAVRHLHLLRFGRWPGAQVAHLKYERLTEQRTGELCGCGSLKSSYAECCMSKDMATLKVSDAIEFVLQGGVRRMPPVEITGFLKNQNNPPQINIMGY